MNSSRRGKPYFYGDSPVIAGETSENQPGIGIFRMERTYENGLLEGEAHFYNADGSLRTTLTYKEGR